MQREDLELTETVDTGVSDAYGDWMSTTIEDRQATPHLAILRHAEEVPGGDRQQRSLAGRSGVWGYALDCTGHKMWGWTSRV